MGGPEKMSQPILAHTRFRFSLEMASRMVLSPRKELVFRGGFGIFLRRIVCALPRSDCCNCLLHDKCLYAAVFEPQSPPDFPAAAKFSPAAPPFVLNPPLTSRRDFHPKETLQFDLVLMGCSTDALPYDQSKEPVSNHEQCFVGSY